MMKRTTRTASKTKEHDDNPPWTPERFARSVPFSGLPADLQRVLRNVRGPQKVPTKVLVSIRLSPDVVATLRASGAGWQTRVDDILRKHM